MKKFFLFIYSLILAVPMIAQNSEIDAAMQETKVQKFIDNVYFYKEIEVTHLWEKDLDIYGKILVDLTNPSNKVGYLEFRTNNKENAMFWSSYDGFAKGDVGSRPMGYLDCDEIESLLKAMKIVNKQSKMKFDEEFQISYVAPGGICFFYKYDEDYDDQKFYFRRAWYSTNRYGTRTVDYVNSGELEVKKSFEEVLKHIEKAKIKLEEELQKDYSFIAD